VQRRPIPSLSSSYVAIICYTVRQRLVEIKMEHFMEGSTQTEVSILHSHRRENFKSYIELTGWAL
jgi:hypothetical protein